MIAVSGPDLTAELIRHAGDRTSLSDELRLAARGAAAAHLDRGRANWVRALEIPADAAVLELGAEYGSLTRYLGERVARVDAVEPDPTRAAAARLRTEDLAGVRVFGEITGNDTYDLVVASESVDLEALRTRLKPGGTLCLAVANPLGVRRLAGGPATGFSLRHWENRLTEAGFTVHRALGCLPDHRIPRVVFTEELVTTRPRLAVELPRLAPEERKLWADLVDGGIARETANGFVILASAGNPANELWSPDKLASYFNTDRAARWCSRGDVYRTEVRRTPLSDSSASGGVAVRAWTDPIADGPAIGDVLVEQPWRAAELLSRWRDLVRARAGEPALWDLIPQNVLVTEDGELHAIDLEWERAGSTEDEVIERGILLLADQLATEGWAGAAEHSTVRLLASWLGVLTECPVGFVDAAAEREAWFQAVRLTGETEGPVLDREHEGMRIAWRRRLADEVATPLPSSGRFTGTELDDQVAVTMAAVDRTISSGDTMFRGNTEHYFKVAADALRLCLHALHGAGRPKPKRVLDFGCGHGRVLRTLRAAFPEAELIACDLDLDGVEYCRTTFDALALPGAADTSEIEQVIEVDLIWSGSVLTHLDREGWDALLRYCARALAPGGVAVLTTHGRRAAHLLENGVNHSYGLDAERTREVFNGYRDQGFGYADYPGQRGYGISLSSPAWVARRVTAEPGLRLAGYAEAGWDNHQDVLVFVKETLETT